MNPICGANNQNEGVDESFENKNKFLVELDTSSKKESKEQDNGFSKFIKSVEELNK